MKSDKLTFQVKFWALIGPFICLLSLFVFFVKGTTTPTHLPVVLLLGVPLCWKWKLKGFAGSIALLCSLLFYYYSDIPLDERFWHLGMGISTAMSLLITALSFEEVEALIDGMKVESRSRLENLWKVDEKLQLTAGELKKKKEKIRELNVKIRSYQKLVDRSTEELVEIRTSRDKVANDLYQTNMEKEELEFHLRKAQDDPPPEAKYLQLRQQFEDKQQLLDKTRKELFRAKERILHLQKEHKEMEMFELSEVEEALEKHLLRMEQEAEAHDAEHQQELDTLQDMLSSLLKEGG